MMSTVNQGVVFSYLLHCEDLSDSSCYNSQRTITINSASHVRNPESELHFTDFLPDKSEAHLNNTLRTHCQFFHCFSLHHIVFFQAPPGPRGPGVLAEWNTKQRSRHFSEMSPAPRHLLIFCLF